MEYVVKKSELYEMMDKEDGAETLIPLELTESVWKTEVEGKIFTLGAT